jgi:hypothetical protein
MCGCGSGSTNTSPTPSAPLAPSTPTVTSIAVSGTSPTVGSTSQLTATATLTNGSTQAITALATWRSSNLSVVTVSPSGLATAVAAGDADITATYSGLEGSVHLHVALQTYGLVGNITEDGTGRPIMDARVEVLNGVNGGKAVLTDSAGAYRFEGLLADSFRMRASANNYESGEQGVTVPAIPRADFALRPSCSLTVTPLRLSVTSGGMVNPTSRISLTASAPTCAWTATNQQDDWLFIAATFSNQQSGYGHSVAGTGSATVFLTSNGTAINSPPHTSTIHVVWRGGQADVIACQPNCLVP